jgi:hypothetical protein
VGHHLLLYTARMEHKAEALRQALGLDSEVAEGQLLQHEDSPTAMAAQLAALALPAHTRLTVHLSGGTKLMAIGVYQFFSTHYPDCRIVYIPFPKNEIVQLYPHDNRLPLRYRVGLGEYLQAYEVAVEEQSWQAKNHTLPKALAEQMHHETQRYQQPPIWEYWKELQKVPYARQQQDYPLSDTLRAGLSILDYQPQREGYLSPAERHFLVGGWWEEYLYHLLREQLRLKDRDIALNLRINQDRHTAHRLVAGNEFDLLFVYQNKLYVLECKTGIQGLKDKSGLQQFNDFVYKLAALRKFFGLGVQLSIVLHQDLSRSTYAESLRFCADRAGLLNISFFHGADCQHPHQLVTRLVGELPPSGLSVSDQEMPTSSPIL